MKWLVTLILLNFFSISCGHTSQVKNKPAHHTKNGFMNTSKGSPPNLISILKWRFSKLFESDINKNHKMEIFKSDLSNSNKKNSKVTWIGHSTVLLQFAGVNILTDPQFSKTASPVSWAGPERITPPAVKKEMLPRIDIVVISHDHYDHLDLDSIKYLYEINNNDIQFFVPLGMKKWFLENKISNVNELDWWNHEKYLGWKITAVPAKHHSGRGLFDHGERLWAGWVLNHPEFNFYYAGDTAYSKDFKLIGSKFGPFDLAVIPIGGYSPRQLFKNVHINPEEAVKIHRDVKSQKSIGVHWGTFLLTDESVEEPSDRLEVALNEKGFKPSSFTAAKYGKTIPIKLLTTSNDN